MKISDVISAIGAELICGDADKDFEGVYVGDLLSRAMSCVESDNLWITIMSNANVVAVAVLTEPAAVILAEGVKLPEDCLLNARNNGVTVLSSPLSAYEICIKLYKHSAEALK